MSSLLLGEIFVIEKPHDNGSFTHTPTGSMLNVGLGLKNLGRTVRIVTDVGRDKAGEIILNYAASHGIELWLPREETRGENTTIIRSSNTLSYPNIHTWDIQDQPESAACKLDLDLLDPHTVAFSSTACHLEPGATKIRNWLTLLRNRCAVFYNPKVRGTQFNNTRIIEEFMTYADVVVTSIEDVNLIYGESTPMNDIARHWKSLGPSLVIITDGPAGAHIFPTTGAPMRIPACDVKVVDSTGAGDAFLAALIDGITRLSMSGSTNKMYLKTLSAPLLRSLGNYASLAASVTVGRHGILPPTREEMAAVMTSTKVTVDHILSPSTS